MEASILLSPPLSFHELRPLSVKDICNLSKVNKKTLSLMQRMTQRDHGKFKTFVDRLSAAKLDEITLKSCWRKLLIGESDAILRPTEDDKELEIFHLNAWEMIKFTGWETGANIDTEAEARKKLCGGIIINESAKHMRVVFSVKEDKENKIFLTVTAFNRKHECFQRGCFEFSEHGLSKDSYKSYCRNFYTYNKGMVPVQIFKCGNKLCIKIVFLELTSDWESPVRAIEKKIETSVDNQVHKYYTYRRFYLILCLKSVIIISKNVSNNDYKVIEHKLEELPIVNCQVIASGIWLVLYPKESSTYTLMHHKSGQKFDLAKFPTTVWDKLSMAEDAFDEDRVILLQQVMVFGANAYCYHYKIALKNGDIVRNGLIDSGGSFNAFGLYGRHLVALSKEELKIFDTFCGMERRLKNAPIKGGEHFAFTDRHLTIIEWYGYHDAHIRKLSFSRPYPQLDHDKQ